MNQFLALMTRNVTLLGMTLPLWWVVVAIIVVAWLWIVLRGAR
jgi:hypothetical protein